MRALVRVRALSAFGRMLEAPLRTRAGPPIGLLESPPERNLGAQFAWQPNDLALILALALSSPKPICRSRSSERHRLQSNLEAGDMEIVELGRGVSDGPSLTSGELLERPPMGRRHPNRTQGGPMLAPPGPQTSTHAS